MRQKRSQVNQSYDSLGVDSDSRARGLNVWRNNREMFREGS